MRDSDLLPGAVAERRLVGQIGLSVNWPGQ